MKVICAGYPKTGTKSLSAALTELGYRVFDYEEQFRYCGRRLQTLMDDGLPTEDIREMYEDVDVVIDIPSSGFWEEIHKAFPDAKVILTERRSEDVWLKSWLNQLKVVEDDMLFKLLCVLSYTSVRFAMYSRAQLRCAFSLEVNSLGGGRSYNEQIIRSRYRQHNQYVKSVVPKTQLLQYHPSDGWEKLCNFLGTPVPDTPFPHVNKGGTVIHDTIVFTPTFQQMKRETFVNLTIVSFIIVVLILKFLDIFPK